MTKMLRLIYGFTLITFLSGCGSGGSSGGSSASTPVGVAVVTPTPDEDAVVPSPVTPIPAPVAALQSSVTPLPPGAEQIKSLNQVTYPGERHDYSGRTKLDATWNIVPKWADYYLGQLVTWFTTGTMKSLKDERSQKYVEQLVKKLVEKAPWDTRYNYKVTIIDSGVINAYAAPGGFIFVNRGLLQNVESEAQLAGILAHEISHITLRHGTRTITKQLGVLAVMSVVFAVIDSKSSRRGPRIGSYYLAQLAMNLLTLKFSRDHETEADIGAAQMLYDSGIDPMAFAEFFRNMGRSGWQPWMNWSVSHPPSDERYTKVQKEIEMSGGLYGTFQCNSEDFRGIQAHLKTLP